MTGEQINNFYKQDQKKYILNENNVILEIMKQKKQENILKIKQYV